MTEGAVQFAYRDLAAEAGYLVAFMDELPGDSFPLDMAADFVRAVAKGEHPNVRQRIADATCLLNTVAEAMNIAPLFLPHPSPPEGMHGMKDDNARNSA